MFTKTHINLTEIKKQNKINLGEQNLGKQIIIDMGTVIIYI